MGVCASRVGISMAQEEPVSHSNFEIERVIGQGGFGKVNAVVKTSGFDKGTWYAMKTLSKAVILERNHVGMVMKERHLLARLHCSQLVNMHYAFQDASSLYIVMDLCLGGDLHYQLSHSPTKTFSEMQARFYVASVIVCLEYMHASGVLHRDIKPENLLLDSRGQLKVTDMGISHELFDGVCTSTSGTRPYMAPEVLMVGHRHTTVADIYSLGITAFQFLVGQRPYRPNMTNMKAIVRMATFVPPERYTDIRHIRRILLAAQERKAPSPEFRFSRSLVNCSVEARDFVQCCLICNPRFRMGSLGTNELMLHPWFAGIQWDAMRQQQVPAPFLPDVRRSNCAISQEELQQIIADEEELDTSPKISPAEQLKFVGYDYRTRVTNAYAGRGERLVLNLDSSADDDRMATITGNTSSVVSISHNTSDNNFALGGSLSPMDFPSSGGRDSAGGAGVSVGEEEEEGGGGGGRMGGSDREVGAGAGAGAHPQGGAGSGLSAFAPSGSALAQSMSAQSLAVFAPPAAAAASAVSVAAPPGADAQAAPVANVPPGPERVLS